MTLTTHPRSARPQARPPATQRKTFTPLGLLLSRWARPLRFALVGGVCGLIQLALLVALLRLRVESLTANVAAYLLSAQVNFLLSNHFIWHDRWSRRASPRDLGRRWLRFHLSIAGTFALSQAVFVGARIVTAPVLASALGIGISALANFAIQDRLTFTRLTPAATKDALPGEREAA